MAFEDYLQGAGSGAAFGGTLGSVVPGLGTALGSGIGGLLGAFGGGLFGRETSKETQIQKQQRELVDQLLASLNGEGPYANLFNASPEAFEKAYGEPAREQFKNVTAPNIQQQFIASGQQRGTGLDDSLTRAGVDLDQLINQQYMQYVQGKEANQQNAISQILGQGRGAGPSQSLLEAGLQGVGGYLSSPSFGSNLESILGSFGSTFQPKSKDQPQGSSSLIDTYAPLSRGFENQYYNPYTGVQS